MYILGRVHLRQAKYVSSMPYICTVKDLSASGACIELKLDLEVGKSLTLAVKSYLGESIELFGEIIWRQKINDELYCYGVRLFNPDNSLSEKLNESVSQLISTKIEDN